MLKAWIDTLNAFSVTLRNVGRPRVTEKLLWKAPRPHPERYRQTFVLTRDEHGEPNCIACGNCARICPSGIIRVDRGKKVEHPVTGKKAFRPATFTLELGACMFCELCVQVCPTDALVMLGTHQPAAFDRESLVLTQDKLYANAELGERAWGSGSRLREMQDPKRKPAPAGRVSGEEDA